MTDKRYITTHEDNYPNIIEYSSGDPYSSGPTYDAESAAALLNEQHEKIEEFTSWERALLKLLEIATKKITELTTKNQRLVNEALKLAGREVSHIAAIGEKGEKIAELNEALVFEQEASTEKDERIKMLEIEVRNNQRLYRP